MAYPTNPIYKLFKDPMGGDVGSVLKQVDGRTWYIPMVEDNTSYQEYLAWVAEGNTPEPADE
jgi:hypothetical protein